MKVFFLFTLAETSFATTSYSFEFFLLVCKSGLQIVHYILRMSRYTNIVYIGRYLVLTYIERFISTVSCFFSYICWSVDCMKSISKFNNFFLTCRETEARFLFEDFNFVLYGKFRLSNTFFAFFIWSVNCSRHFLSHIACQ